MSIYKIYHACVFCICPIAIPEGDHHPKGRKKEGAMSGDIGHLTDNCPKKEKSSKDEKSKSYKDKEGKTMTFKKNKKCHMCIVLSRTLMPQVKVMMMRRATRSSHLPASPSIRSPPSSTPPHHVSWPRTQRYNMMRAIVGVILRMWSPPRRN
jgi:hypothetical protein